MRQIGNYSFSSGDMITCKIKDIPVTGKIFFSDNHGDPNQFWICHDNSDFSGSESPNKFEYVFSWTFYVTRDGDITDDVSDLKPMIDGVFAKSGVTLSESLRCFVSMVPGLSPFFNIKCGVFDDYVNFYDSEVEGNIMMETKPRGIFKAKKVEIKLSRFVRQVTNKIATKSKTFINLTDKQVEDIHNKYVSFQKGSLAKIEYLTGEEIKEGYNSANYFSGNSTLHKSCMTDRFDAMGIYTNNPEQVKLAVIKIDGKIAARSLVWKTTDGGLYHDRIYYANDWMEPLMESIFLKSEITHINKENFKVVQLKEWKFKYNPYVDNFYNLDAKSGQLIYFSGNFRTLRTAGGEIYWY